MKPGSDISRIFLSLLLIQLPALFHHVKLLLSGGFGGGADLVIVDRPAK